MTPALVLRRFWTLEPAAYSLRVFLALAAITLVCWWRGDMASRLPSERCWSVSCWVMRRFMPP